MSLFWKFVQRTDPKPFRMVFTSFIDYGLTINVILQVRHSKKVGMSNTKTSFGFRTKFCPGACPADPGLESAAKNSPGDRC